MPKNKINGKWYSLIWVALILSSFMRRAYELYIAYSTIDLITNTIIIDIVTDIIFSGLLPAVLCYLCASIMINFAYRRRNVFISRNDFIYIAMIFTAAARFIMGFIEIFAILEPAVYSYTSILLDVTVFTAAMFVMYFAVLVPTYKMNDRINYEVYIQFAVIYLVVQGLNTIIPALGIIMIYNGGTSVEQALAVFEDYYGYIMSMVDYNMFIAAIAAICIFGVWIIISLALSAVLHKKAAAFTKANPDEKYEFERKWNEKNNAAGRNQYDYRDDYANGAGDGYGSGANGSDRSGGVNDDDDNPFSFSGDYGDGQNGGDNANTSENQNQTTADSEKKDNKDDKVFDEFDI